MQAEPYVNKYEWLQVLLVVLLFCAHFLLFGYVLIGAVYLGLPIGALEIAIGWKMSSRLTFRAPEAPTSVRSALGGLRPWLLVFGACLAVVSVGYWAAIFIS